MARPTIGKAVGVRLPTEQLTRVHAYAKDMDQTVAEAVRQLVARGLRAAAHEGQPLACAVCLLAGHPPRVAATVWEGTAACGQCLRVLANLDRLNGPIDHAAPR